MEQSVDVHSDSAVVRTFPKSEAALSAEMESEAENNLSVVDRSVLLTILYADLFDYALSIEELFERFIGRRIPRARLTAAVKSLSETYLSVVDGYVVWRGREKLVEVRRRRKAAAVELWEAARRYARWLGWVPFVRMVAVSGSLAVENAEQKSDVDLFCITGTDRLWLARLFIVPMSKVTRRFRRRFPIYLCPNYIVARDALEVCDRNLFTAYEVAQAIPIWGARVFDRFVEANVWIRRFLPHIEPRVEPEEPSVRTPSRLVGYAERLLGGRIGDALDRAAHKLFLFYYRRRALRSGWDWSVLESAYQRNRYVVPEGGYVGVVRRHFARLVQSRLGAVISASELETLFPEIRHLGATCYDWDGLFRDEYGAVAATTNGSTFEHATRETSSDRHE